MAAEGQRLWSGCLGQLAWVSPGRGGCASTCRRLRIVDGLPPARDQAGARRDVRTQCGISIAFPVHVTVCCRLVLSRAAGGLCRGGLPGTAGVTEPAHAHELRRRTRCGRPPQPASHRRLPLARGAAVDGRGRRHRPTLASLARVGSKFGAWSQFASRCPAARGLAGVGLSAN